MSWPPVAADLYRHGAPSSYFTGVDAGDISAALLAAMGRLSRKVGPRVGGPAASWTWTDSAGQEDATRDVCVVAAADLSLTQGLVLPVQTTVDGDRTFNDRARAVESLWSRMGTPASSPNDKTEPLYSGLVDATPTTEGLPGGWATSLPSVQDGQGCGVV